MTATLFADGFAERLRKARENAGLTQRELGGAADVNYSQISRYEQGSAFPRPGVLLRMANVMGVPIEHLRDGTPVRVIDFVGPKGDKVFGVTFSVDEYEMIKRAADETGQSVEEAVVTFVREHLKRVATMGFTGAPELDPKKKR